MGEFCLPAQMHQAAQDDLPAPAVLAVKTADWGLMTLEIQVRTALQQTTT